MSHNAPGSAERELHTPGGSRRRARLQEDLDAGAKIADELNKSADRSLTPPLSDGEFARLSSGEVCAVLCPRRARAASAAAVVVCALRASACNADHRGRPVLSANVHVPAQQTSTRVWACPLFALAARLAVTFTPARHPCVCYFLAWLVLGRCPRMGRCPRRARSWLGATKTTFSPVPRRASMTRSLRIRSIPPCLLVGLCPTLK